MHACTCERWFPQNEQRHGPSGPNSINVAVGGPSRIRIPEPNLQVLRVEGQELFCGIDKDSGLGFGRLRFEGSGALSAWLRRHR